MDAFHENYNLEHWSLTLITKLFSEVRQQIQQATSV